MLTRYTWPSAVSEAPDSLFNFREPMSIPDALRLHPLKTMTVPGSGSTSTKRDQHYGFNFSVSGARGLEGPTQAHSWENKVPRGREKDNNQMPTLSLKYRSVRRMHSHDQSRYGIVQCTVYTAGYSHPG